MLKRALRWHADNPGQRPKISYPSASAQSPCRYRIYDVQLTTEEDAIAVKITVPVAGTEDFTVTVDEQDVDYDVRERRTGQHRGRSRRARHQARGAIEAPHSPIGRLQRARHGQHQRRFA